MELFSAYRLLPKTPSLVDVRCRCYCCFLLRLMSLLLPFPCPTNSFLSSFSQELLFSVLLPGIEARKCKDIYSPNVEKIFPLMTEAGMLLWETTLYPTIIRFLQWLRPFNGNKVGCSNPMFKPNSKLLLIIIYFHYLTNGSGKGI